MNIQSISKGLTLVNLLPEDCQRLARVCELAVERLGQTEQAAEYALIEAMGAAFKAAGIAAQVQLGYEVA